MKSMRTPRGNNSRNARGKLVRYLTAIVLIIAYLIISALFYRECVVTSGSASSDGNVCQPASLDSAPVVAAILLLIALIWPEIAEISILGVSLKRRLAEAERTAASAAQESAKAAAATVALQAQINQVVATYSAASASAENHTNVIFDPAWTPARAAELRDAYVDVKAQVKPLAGAEAQQSLAELSLQLLREYQDLAVRLGIARTRPVGRPSEATRELYRARQAFIADYQPQVSSVREARNSVAHAEQLSREELIEAIQVVRLLDGRLSEAFADRGMAEGAEGSSAS